ncbi:MAG TPA: YihY/virulence factor BrkB family protein [Gemmatimonadales bacterium]|nr:YihY/virulence factor BrkB family protein [Gemmatimonadales bacterium]
MNGEGGWHRSVTGIVRRTLEAAYEDNVPFLASALAFDLLLTAIPFVGLALAVVGFLVQHQIATHQLDVHELLQRFLPLAVASREGQADAFGAVEQALSHLVRQRVRLTLFAVPLFLWFSTRLFSGLRAALNEVFDTDERRPWPVAKLLDLGMMAVTGSLLVANGFLSAIGGGKDSFLWRFGTELGALAFGTVVFFLIFKFLPSRRIYWRTGLVASLFCAVAFEIAKRLYTLYVARFATFDRVASDANIVAFFLFLLWIYYTAYVFLLGGEVAETYDLIRMRRQQRVRLG